MLILHKNKQSDKDHFRTHLSSEKIEKYESRKIIYITYDSFDKYDQSQFKLWRKLEWKKLAMVAEQFWVTFGKLLRRSSYRYEDTLSWNKLSLVKLSLDELSLDKLSLDMLSLDKMSLDK